MIRYYLYVLIIIFVCFFNFAFSAISVEDSTHQQIKLIKPATRIISLAPNLTEMLFAIGAGSNIVGTSVASDYPAGAKNIPIISNNSELNLEAIVALKPDLIVAWKGGNPSRDLSKLKQLNFPVFFFAPKTIHDISDTINALGILTGKEKQSRMIAKQFNQQIAVLKKRYASQKRVTVFYEIWQKPLFTTGHSSLITQAIQLCGGKNIFEKSFGFAPQVSVEAVLAADPQVIIGGYDDITNSRWKDYWLKWPQLTAVKHHTIFAIDPDLLQRFGPRFAMGAAILCRDLSFAKRLH